MKFRLPNLPPWAWLTLTALAAAGSVIAEAAWPRHAIGPPLESALGFYAGAGFGAAVAVLACAWLARFLRA